MKVKDQIKAIARENGAALVGIASRERLNDAPPSGDPDYLLPATRSVISFVIPHDRKIVRDFLGKKDWLSKCADRKLQYQKVYAIADRLADFLSEKGFEARGVYANGTYRPEPDTIYNRPIPDFSHRYAAVAAGLGQLGWSGSLMTPQFGSAVVLGSVLTSAEVEADPLLEENPCDQCKLCTTVCPVEMIDNKETVLVTVAGREYTIAKKKINACCSLGCQGYHSLGPNKKWSTWSPYRVDYPLPEDEAELAKLTRRIQEADPGSQARGAKLTHRERSLDEKELIPTHCGNCGEICWEKREDRQKNQRLLMDSGIVVLNTDGERVAVSGEGITEVDTPYNVRVAVLRRAHAMAGVPEEAAPANNRDGAGRTPLDSKILAFMAARER